MLLPSIRRFYGLFSLLLIFVTPAFADEVPNDGQAEPVSISYHQQIVPLFQARCVGCHQPARALGGYNMLSFEQLVKGGESTLPAIVPGDPDASYLVDQITPGDDGKAEMPKNLTALSPEEVDLIRTWVKQGAKNDAPTLGPEYDSANPPVYTRPPVITSLDYSPDGRLLAVPGFHEVLLHDVTGDEPKLLRRLVGLSERIESVRFSPDGSRLAVVGGQPGRAGEVQVWDVKTGELLLSHSVTYDTLYGASWSPDGSLIAFGGGDNTVRAIDAKTGEQKLYQLSHNDWVRDTVFNNAGDYVVSVGRDMTAKLIELETERFVDNITSITPKALKGGINGVAMHPKFDMVLIGGADGTPKVYRIFRKTARVIGDDANLVRRFPEMPGRIFGVDYSADGTKIACGSSLNGEGMVRVYSAEFDDELPSDIRAIVAKRVNQTNAVEKAKLEKFVTSNVGTLSTLETPSGIYAVRFHPNGERVAAAGADGRVRIIEVTSGNVVTDFVPVPLESESHEDELTAARDRDLSIAPKSVRSLADDVQVAKLSVSPAQLVIDHPYDYGQLVVTGTTSDGETLDLTRLVIVTVADPVVRVDRSGLVLPNSDGKTTLTVSHKNLTAAVPVVVRNSDVDQPVSYVRDVMPVLGKLGCNQGTCHGSKDGKNGFKLSLRGYDPIYDTRAFTDDLASRRVNVAAPDNSLMLLKASGRVPHQGGQLTKPGEAYYSILRRWIAEGAELDLETPRVVGIRLEPENPIVQRIGDRQQIRVIATYEDGAERDVTRESFIESGNTDIVETSGAGLMTTLRRGEAPLLARFEGSYAATTMTVMGDRSGFVWQPTEVYSPIDELVNDKLQRMKILPSGVCTDSEFVRRVYLDLTGLPPTAEQTEAFLKDNRESRLKRQELIDALIGSEPFVDYWSNKWSDLLQVNRKFLGAEGAKLFHNWIREQVANNTPYDQFAYEVLTASGSNRDNPPAAYYKTLREPAETMENTTHLFLAIRFNCNKCHDHPFERWTQDQYYETAAFFAQVDLKADPNAKGKRIGGTAVEGAKPLYEIVGDKPAGEMVHDRTGEVTPPAFPFLEDFETGNDLTRRERLARWMTSSENPYFAKSYVNRLWGYMTGVGLIEPLDDIRAGNPPTNPELLDYLTREFVESGFDTRHVLQLICNSATYQRSIQTNRWNAGDRTNYSHAIAKRLPAEVLYDSIHLTLGATPNIPGVPKGTRATQLPDAGVKLPSGFLANLGRPARESACECERSSELQLGPVMALVGGPTVGNAISDPGNDLVKLVREIPDDRDLIDQIFLRILSRHATKEEIATALEFMSSLEDDHAKLVAARDAYVESTAEREQKRAAERQARIDAAQAELERYRQSIKAAEAKRAADRERKITEAEKALNEYGATLDEKFNAWAASPESASTSWRTLSFGKMTSTDGGKLSQAEDGSIFVTGPPKKTTYDLFGTTDLNNITGLKLEALTDSRLASNGPGRSQNGNFVLSELELKSGPIAGEPKTAAKFGKAEATFSQASYPVASAVNGKTAASGDGWAIVPNTGKPQTAIFSLKEPLRGENGLKLAVRMVQPYQDGTHSLGKFRISVTDASGPLGFGLPETIAKLLAIAPNDRTPEQTATLRKHYQNQDAGWQARNKALAAARAPLPVDPGLKMRQDQLAAVQAPLKPDGGLERLNRAVDLSAAQLKNSRLTAVQDLAWALINSPAFLFNR